MVTKAKIQRARRIRAGELELVRVLRRLFAQIGEAEAVEGGGVGAPDRGVEGDLVGGDGDVRAVAEVQAVRED